MSAHDTDPEVVQKVRRGPPPSLGQSAYYPHRSDGLGHPVGRPLTSSERAQQAALAKHGACVDHLKVEGVRHKVCILRGQDPAVVVAEARALAGLA